MKFLFLKRQSIGGISAWAHHLAQELRGRGHTVDIEDAEPWMMPETQPHLQKPVTERVRSLGANADLVVAWGYRCAWACAEAFRHKRPWIYMAYDLPKTLHPELIAHLTDSRMGICVSQAVVRVLDEALAGHLAVAYPGIAVPQPIDRAAEKMRWKFDPERPVVGALGRLTPERGLFSLLDDETVTDAVLARLPDTQFAVALLDSGYNRNERVRLALRLENPLAFIGMLDLLVVPSRSAGWSMAAMEAMSLGTPVLMRNVGGLSEMAEDRYSALYFGSEENLGNEIANALQMPANLDSIAATAAAKIAERHTLATHADRFLAIVQRAL